jgi:hypothetical protein
LWPIDVAGGAHLVIEAILSLFNLFEVGDAFLHLSHGLSLVKEVLPILHEVDLFEEKVRLLLAEALLLEHLLSGLLELVVGPLNLLDVDLLFLNN